jgi:hypothetical protein
MKRFFTNLYEFLLETFWFFYNLFLSLIMGKSVISIKKVLAYFFSFAAIYVGIFLDKPDIVMQYIGIVVLLLGLRSYDKSKYIPEDKGNPVGFKTNKEI